MQSLQAFAGCTFGAATAVLSERLLTDYDLCLALQKLFPADSKSAFELSFS